MDSVSGSNIAGKIAYDDLREWLVLADRLGEVEYVHGASWEEDIGLAAEAVLREENGPCVVFDEVPGCPKGFRLLMNMFAGTRRNMTLGFPEHLGKWELSNAYRESFLVDQQIIKHEIVEDGPVFENILTGDDIDVTKFPAPIWHENDGGRYIGTGTYSVTLDPEDGTLNAGAYRAQVHGPKEVGFLTARGHHGYIHRQKYKEMGQKMPVCMVLGGDPLSFYFGGTEAPMGTFELDMVAGLRGKPMQLVEGKVTGLPFPANAEVVLEGWVDPNETKMEGPFGEWTGHYAGGMEPRTTLHIEAIYHRNDPIILGVPPMGQGPDELARYRAVMRSAMLKQNIMDGADRRPVPGGGLCVEICHRGGRGCRCHTTGSADLGDVCALRSQTVDRFHHRRLGQPGRSDADAKAARSRRHDPFGRDHRCLPAVPLDRSVPDVECREPGSPG